MYNIEQTRFGYQITFAGNMDEAELQEWITDSRSVLESSPEKFGILVDMRELQLLDDDEQELMREGQQLYRETGMIRSAVVLESAVLTLQFRRLAKESGIYDWERYINASDEPNWREHAEEWLIEGVDPDYRR
ncbi:hypothetical protein ACFOZ7_19255 [Natribaculum luteum]|uniref:STAS/SEC14 domain-containing protein n=1 Tax=Natribaculum luteum TaxID=1586232 RepID=A0ABD5P461_9EURY|nr:hypothetical protein [Natribaculum luteum]